MNKVIPQIDGKVNSYSFNDDLLSHLFGMISYLYSPVHHTKNVYIVSSVDIFME